MADNDFGAGWAIPVLGVGGRKAHYYSAGFRGASLCGKYVLLGGQREDDNHESPDNCAECTRRYYAKHPELELPRRLRRVRVEVVERVSDPEFPQCTVLAAGTRGWVKGVTPESLRRLASQGAHTTFESTRPKRSYNVRADNLRTVA